MNRAKPFCIAKREVWEAYKQVKANQGAAGVDGQSIEDFEKDLSNNLYRIWNRMSSGTYFPPPVRRVDIPKGDSGKTRPLGIPAVSDRIAQTVVKTILGTDTGAKVPQGLIRISAREICSRRFSRGSAAMLATRLGFGSRHRKFFRPNRLGTFDARCAPSHGL
jgi:hypothetical protein